MFYKAKYNWETVSAYFQEMVNTKIASFNEEEKRIFYAVQIMKIETFVSLQKKLPPQDKFEKWMIDEGDMILSQANESQTQGDNAKKTYLFSCIIGQIVWSSENEHLLDDKQKIYPPIEKFFYYAYEATLEKFNLSPYNTII